MPINIDASVGGTSGDSEPQVSDGEQPYELLARFATDGKVAGVSVRTLTTVGGRSFESDPVGLASAEDPAFVAFAEQFAAAAVAERDELLTTVETLTAERDELRGQIEPLTAELELLRNPPGPDLTTTSGAKEAIAAERYRIETGGIMVGDQPISTARDEIGHWFPRFYDAIMWLQGDATVRAGNPDGVYPYKPKTGDPVLFSAAQVVRAYQCMAWFINACFAAEIEIVAELQTKPIHVVLDGMAEKWPVRNFEWA